MKKYFNLALLLAFFLTGCVATTPVDVSTDYDRNVNFGQYRTFKWFQDKPTAGIDSTYKYNTFLDQRIRNAVEAQLIQKGMSKVTGPADLLIAYDVKVITRQSARPDYAFAPGFGYGYSYWYGYRYNYGYSRFGRPMLIEEYKDGTIIIDLVDAKDNQLIWRGWGQMEVNEANISEAEVNKIVTNILAKFPPGTNK